MHDPGVGRLTGPSSNHQQATSLQQSLRHSWTHAGLLRALLLHRRPAAAKEGKVAASNHDCAVGVPGY